jgi:IS66 Orf2 like protein/Family of unknown function (DUF5372)
MIQLVPQLRILLACEPVDFRKGIDALAALCKSQLAQEPMSGAIFVFRNRSGTALKLLTYDGRGYWLSRKRQNTYVVTQLAADHATIIDPTHPLFGQTLPILRASRHHLKERIVVALPDGRERRIPVSITNLIDRPSDNSTAAGLISVRTLLPLAELIRVMVAPQEENIHGATSYSTAAELPRCNQSPGTGPNVNVDALEKFASQPSESTDTVSGRVDSPHSQANRSDREGGER